MKHLRRLMALVTAMVMMFAMSITALAGVLPEGTKEANKTITITSPADLASTDTTTYHVYKVFNATSTGSNEFINYTVMENKTLPLTATDGLSKFDKDVAGNIHFYTKANNEADWVENTTTPNLSAEMIAAIGQYVSGEEEVGYVEINGPNTEKTVKVPDYGYYYITTTTGTVVTIDSTNPHAKVVDKNSVPSVDKSIANITNGGTIEDGEGEDNTKEVGKAKIGDVVTYSVVVHAKKGAVNYIFHDKLSSGLSLEAQSYLTVKVGEDSLNPSNYEVKYWNDTDYADGAESIAECVAGDNITIRFTNEYLATLDDPTDITISYNAKINDNAVIASTGNPNIVDLEYGQDPIATGDSANEPTKKTEEDEATVYTYALALKKVNQSGVELANATFRFPFYVKKTADQNGAYIYAFETLPAEFGEGDNETNYTNELTTPASGEITIKGVQNVDYEINETVAPDGYNKLTYSFTITPQVTNATTTTTSITTYLDADGNIVDQEVSEGGHTVNYTNDYIAVGGFQPVVNKSGTELPSTGGIGTTIFYIVGGVMVAGAVIFLLTKRRMAGNE